MTRLGALSSRRDAALCALILFCFGIETRNASLEEISALA
ncbi:metabolite transport protein [Klebsiella michiganensis]|nr:hypothetical protein HMPREF1502_1738 [Klebsiella sp. AS10]QXC98628.1 hypothetical protein MKleb_3128 [Klebsiella sp. PL-2018]SBL86985.1 metabolite transport protein [Klebsiella michiganensis]